MLWLILLIIIVGVIYLSSMQGITCCNSGSLYALVRAIAEKRKLEINDFIKYTKYMDYSKVKDKYYTDRPPGIAFAAVPIYLLGGNVTLVAVIFGILSSAFVYLITMQIINNPIIAFSIGLIFAFCTINWRYSTTFILHPLSTFLVLLSVYGLFVNFPVIVIGLILGLATIVEYTDAVYIFGIVLAEAILGNYSLIPFLIIGYGIGVIPLLLYNKKCFGSPFTTSYKYSSYFKWSNSFKTTFVTPIFNGLIGLLFFIKNKNGLKIPGGILTLSPVLIFGIIGFFYLPYKILILFLCLTIPLSLLISKHKTYWAGGGGDHRYLSSMIPFIAIPIALSIENLDYLLPVIIFLALISFFMVVLKMIALTVSVKDLKKINPNFLSKDKDKKEDIFSFLKLKYIGKLITLAFEGLFVRKINLEDKD